MTNFRPRTTTSCRPPKPEPAVISIDGVAVGLAIDSRNGFRFLSTQPRFDLLDGSIFRRLDDMRAAASRLDKAARDTSLSRPVQKAVRLPEWLLVKDVA